MIARMYTIPTILPWDEIKPTPHQFVFIFECDPYEEINGLHQYHKHRRAWSKCAYKCSKILAGKRRTHQVERWCKLSRLNCTVEII